MALETQIHLSGMPENATVQQHLSQEVFILSDGPAKRFPKQMSVWINFMLLREFQVFSGVSFFSFFTFLKFLPFLHT